MKLKKFLPLIIIFFIILSSQQVFAEDTEILNDLNEYNTDDLYITETNTSIVNYTPGQSNIVHVSTSYPNFIETEEYDYIGSFNVYVDTIDGNGFVETPYKYNIHSLDFDLKDIDDRLTSGIHRLYFGPSPFALSLEVISAEYHPLIVVVNTNDKTNTVIWINQTSVALGDKITGLLTDGYNGLPNKIINYNTPNGTKSTKTDENGVFEIVTEYLGQYSNFNFQETDEYNAHTSNTIVNVTQGKYQVIINENIVKFTSTDSYITGSINYPSNAILWDDLWVWFNGNQDTATPAYDSDDKKITLTSKTFKIDLNKLYTTPSTSNFTITIGPRYGLDNEVIRYNNLSLDLDTVFIVKGNIKIPSTIKILENTTIQDEYIVGVLTDEYGGIYNKTISYKSPSGEEKTTVTNANGKFYILANEVGIYKDFKFSGDNLHINTSSNTEVIVTPAEQVFKINLNETIVNYIAGESYIISGNLTYPGNLNFNQELYYTIGDNTKKLPLKTQIKDKKFKIDIDDLDLSESSTITIGLENGANNNFITTNNLKYNNITLQVNMNSKTKTIIRFNTTNVKIGEEIIGYLETIDKEGLNNKTITYTSPEGDRNIITSTNGIFIILANMNGEYKNFQYLGDDTYSQYTSNVTIQVGNTTGKVNVTVIDDTFVIINNTLTVYLLSQDSSNINEGNIELRITDTCIANGEVNNNHANLNINCPTGEYNGTLIYTGENKYNNYTKNVKILIKAENEIIILIPNIETTENSKLTIPVTVKYSNNQNVNNGNIKLEILNKEYSKEVTNGLAEIQLLIDNTTGIIPIKITYTNQTYTKSTNSTITVNKQENTSLKTKITLSFIELENGGNLKVILKDENENPISANINLTLTRLNNNQFKIYNLNTNSSGEFLLDLHLAPGDYSAKAEYSGDKTHSASESELRYLVLTGKPSNAIFEDTSKIDYIYGNSNNFTGILKDKNGEILKGYHVLLNVTRLSSGASKVYDVTTDYNGQYLLQINLAPGEYTIRSAINDKNFVGNSFSTISILRDNQSEDLRKESILTINPFNSYYGSGETFNGYLKYVNNEPIAGHYIEVTLSNTKGANKTYTVISDYNGYFNLPITLAVGVYGVVCVYNGTETIKCVRAISELNIY